MTVCMYRDIHTLQPYIIDRYFLSTPYGTNVSYTSDLSQARPFGDGK